MRSDKAAILIKIAALEFEKMANPMLQEHDLTGAQYKILKYLYANQDTPVRQVEIEKYYSLTTPTTLGLLETLEKKDFICRRQNPDDKRSRIIALTDKALEMQEILNALGEALEEKFTRSLTADEHKKLISLLQKLLNADISDEEKELIAHGNAENFCTSDRKGVLL